MVDNVNSLTFANHLERDARMDGWSVHGLGSFSHTTEQWVNFVLSFELAPEIPDELREMYGRVQACMVYGCYHYPLFTMGNEELLRFLESALKAAVCAAGASAGVSRSRFEAQIDWALKNGLIDEEGAVRWHAVRQLRNAASHKRENMLGGPNDALMGLRMAKELAEEVFRSATAKRTDS